MRAEAVVEVSLVDGRTVCTRLRSEPPLTLRRTGRGVVHQVGSGAGPIGGDELLLRVRVGPGAELTLRTVAASLVLPGPQGLPSRTTLEAEVGRGGHLEVLPEPQVLVAGSEHEVHTQVRLARGATLLWRDETVLGRTGEPGGSLLHRLRVDREGRAVVRQDLAVGPRWPDSEGPAGVDGARCVGTLLVVGPASGVGAPDVGDEPAGDPPPTSAARVGGFDLGGGALLTTALASSAVGLRTALHPGSPSTAGVCEHVNERR